MEGVKKFYYTTKIEVPSGLEEIIPVLAGLEAQKTIPFSLEEVVWNYRVSPTLEKETFEITYTVANTKSLESFYHEAVAAEIEGTIFVSNDELLPPSLVAARLQRQQKRHWRALAALLFFSLLVSFFYLSHETERTKILAAQASLLLYQEKKETVESTQALAAARALKKRGSFLLSLVQARAAWPELLNELHQAQPPRYLWITKLSPVFEEPPHTKNKSTHSNPKEVEFRKNSITALEIEGLYLENPHQAAVVDEWAHNLKKSALFALQEKRDEEIITLRCTPDNTAYAYPFKLSLPLKRSLAVYTSE